MSEIKNGGPAFPGKASINRSTGGMMRTHLNSPTPVLRGYSRSLVSRDWFPLAVLGALYLIACGVAPAYELLAGIAR